MRPFRTPAVLAAVTLIVALSTTTTGRASPGRSRFRVADLAPSSSIGFGEPTVSGVQGVGFEPDLRIDDQGRIYTSVPGSLSSGTSWIWRSLDGGLTFKWVPAATPQDGKIDTTCAGGGDSELATDSSGNLYFADLTLANFSTSRSGDQGVTFAPSSCTAVSDSPVDRQWYAVDGDPTNGGSIYLSYDLVAGGAPECGNVLLNNDLRMARSPGGIVTDSLAGVEFNPSKSITGILSTCAEGIMGNNEVSPRNGKVFVIHDNATFDAILIGVCTPVDFLTDPTGLQCVDKPVASFPGYVTGADFPAMAIDRSGNVYAVWSQAPGTQGDVTGNAVLMFSSSTDDGDTWKTPVQIPTPGLSNNVMAWPAAGDAGRVDIAWYGTPGTDPGPGGCSGPDGVRGDWSLFFTQTRNGAAAIPTFTAPVVASDHFIHRGSIQTVMGGQCGDRTLGDFLQLRVDPDGAAGISYGDSNNIDEFFAPHSMFVKQNRGPSVYGATPKVHGPSKPRNAVTDVAGDGTYEANSTVSANEPNLDILASSVSKPSPGHYRVTMKVADLASLAVDHSTTNPDTTAVWLTQWLVPSTSDGRGGRNFHVYMESVNGGPPTFWVGQNAAITCCVGVLGGGVTLTYPGDHQIPGAYDAATGVITIDVPASDVKERNPIDNRLHQVITSTMTLTGNAETPPPVGGIGGSLFNLIDSSPTYDFVPPVVELSGHAHTNLDNGGKERDIHVDAQIEDDEGDTALPSGSLIYVDDRGLPGRGPNLPAGLQCSSGNVRSMTPAGRREVMITGDVTCNLLPAAAAFTMDVIDGGSGESGPNPDRYHMIVYDGKGQILYDYRNDTTPGLGDLSVRISAPALLD
jgi:hypothetical protein